jgi:hypothetical protein
MHAYFFCDYIQASHYCGLLHSPHGPLLFCCTPSTFVSSFLFPLRFQIWEKICDTCLFVSGLFHLPQWCPVPSTFQQMTFLSFFMAECHSIYIFCLFIYWWHQGLFYNLAVVNRAMINVEMQVSLLYSDFDSTPRNYMMLIFFFLLLLFSMQQLLLLDLSNYCTDFIFH